MDIGDHDSTHAQYDPGARVTSRARRVTVVYCSYALTSI